MNFSVLPPEVNSVRMFAVTGPGPIRSAAAAWDGLANELGSAANLFGSAISGLASESWQGPASAAIAGAAAPYAGWLTAAASRAGRAAAQAKAAVMAFEAARAATVHPARVAANRIRLVSLIASNLLGQNTPAIAAAEAQYEQMWAQDVAALVGYQGGASAVAAQLASWHQWLQQLPHLLLRPDASPGDPDVGASTDKVLPLENRAGSDICIALTGDNHRAFGAPSSGTGNFVFANSRFFHTGVGRSDLLSTRFGNSGTATTGLANSGFHHVGAFNARTQNTGSFNAGGFNFDAGGFGLKADRFSRGMFIAGQIDMALGNSGDVNAGSGSLGSLGPGSSRFADTSSNGSATKTAAR